MRRSPDSQPLLPHWPSEPIGGKNSVRRLLNRVVCISRVYYYLTKSIKSLTRGLRCAILGITRRGVLVDGGETAIGEVVARGLGEVGRLEARYKFPVPLQTRMCLQVPLAYQHCFLMVT